MEKKLLIKSEEVFHSDRGTNVIYDGSYKSEEVFIVEHMPTGKKAIIDHNEQVLNSVIGRIKRTKALVCDHKPSGDILKFHHNSREHSISLRLYVYAKYGGISLKDVRGKNIMLDDESAMEDDIQDLRSCNLYDAGEIRPYTKARAVELVTLAGEKYIKVTIYGKPDGKPEYAIYSPELYEMLAKPSYCCISFGADNGRGIAAVHYGRGKKCYTVVNLGRFILLYYTHFGRYKNMNGSVRRFISDFYKLNTLHKGEDAAHINSCNWLHTKENLVFMEHATESNPNADMRAWIKWFGAGYDAFPIVNAKGEILMSVKTPFSDISTYIKFRSPQGYADFQLKFQGRENIKSYNELITPSCVYSTPEALIKEKIINRNTVDKNEPSVEEWHKRRDEILAVEDDRYITWEDHSLWYVLTVIVSGGEQPGLAWLLRHGE